MNFMILFIIIGSLSMFVYIGFMLIKNEMAKSKWLPTMKVGDDVNFSTISNNVNAVITDLSPTDDEDIVEVKVLVDKKSLYPGKTRDINSTIL
jgi:hypothetical protein